jgi:hypothetical protein
VRGGKPRSIIRCASGPLQTSSLLPK